MKTPYIIPILLALGLAHPAAAYGVCPLDDPSSEDFHDFELADHDGVVLARGRLHIEHPFEQDVERPGPAFGCWKIDKRWVPSTQLPFVMDSGALEAHAYRDPQAPIHHVRIAMTPDMLDGGWFVSLEIEGQEVDTLSGCWGQVHFSGSIARGIFRARRHGSADPEGTEQPEETVNCRPFFERSLLESRPLPETDGREAPSEPPEPHASLTPAAPARASAPTNPPASS